MIYLFPMLFFFHLLTPLPTSPLPHFLLYLNIFHSSKFLRSMFFFDTCISFLVDFFIVFADDLVLFTFLGIEDVLGEMAMKEDSFYFSILAEFV